MNREEALEILNGCKLWIAKDCELREALDMAIEALSAEQKTGEWVKAVDDGVWSFTDAYAECSQCHKVTFNGWSMNYCPNCGADMRGKE